MNPDFQIDKSIWRLTYIFL